MRNITLSFPQSIKANEYSFKINTDDFFDVDSIVKHLKSKGIKFKKSYQQHKTRCIGYHIFKIPTTKLIKNFEENISFCNTLFNDFSN